MTSINSPGIIMRVIIFLTLVFVPQLTFSHPHTQQQSTLDERVCAPFRNGVVDQAIVDSMLKASEEGKLYRIQPKSSRVGFCVNSAVGRIEGRFWGVQGGLALRRDVWGDESQMLVMVDTNTLTMNKDYLKDMVKGESFLDTHTYSKILFVSTKLWWRNQNNAFLQGNLTMHGVTKPIYFNVEISVVPNNDPQSVADLVVIATSFLKRSDFGMNNLSILASDTVELCMRIEAALFIK